MMESRPIGVSAYRNGQVREDSSVSVLLCISLFMYVCLCLSLCIALYLCLCLSVSVSLVTYAVFFLLRVVFCFIVI